MNELEKNLQTAIDRGNAAIDAQYDVLRSGSHDVIVENGETVPSLDKRLEGMVAAVTSVNGQTGAIKIDSDALGLGSASKYDAMDLPVSTKTKDEIDKINNAENISHSVYVPNSGGSIGAIGGTFRGFADGVNFIIDSAHDTFGMTGISKFDTYTVRVHHQANFGKVGTLICTTDETLAAMGVIAGGSVGRDYSDIKIIAPLYICCKGNGTITRVSPLFNGSVAFDSVNSNPSAGTLRFTHPLKSVASHQAIVSNRVFIDNVSKPVPVGIFNNDGGTYTQVHAFGEVDESVWIRYNNTSASFEAAQGINKALYSFSFNSTSGLLTITHPAVKTGAYLTNPIINPYKTANRYAIYSMGATQTVVLCYDITGAVVKNLTEANFNFFFSIKPAKLNMSLVAMEPNNEFTIFVGNCHVPIDNLKNAASGNIWIYGAMNK